MSSLTRFTCFSNILSTYIKIRRKKKIPYRDKVGDQQQVELRREKNYLSHKELLRKTEFSKIARSIYKNQLHFYILAMNNLN